MSVEQKLLHIRHYESQSLQVFLRNLNIRSCDFIRSKTPGNLEEAINLYLENENFTQTQNLTLASQNRNNTQYQNKNNVQPTQNHLINAGQFMPARNIPRQNYQMPIGNYQNNFQNLNAFNQMRQMPQQSQFPSQPINVQPRPIQYRFPTNAQTFGPKQNVFKPNPNRQPQGTPEPMSIQSRQSLPPRPIQNQQSNQQRPLNQSQIRNQFPWFQPKPTPKFVAQELHAINDVPNETPDHYYSNYNNENDMSANYQIPDQQGAVYNINSNFDENYLNYQDCLTDAESSYQNSQNCENYPNDEIDLENENFLKLPQTNEQM